MQRLNLKPSHKLVKSYYETLGNYGQLNIDHEMAVRSAFQNLLAGCGHQFKWTLVPEYQFHPAKLSAVRIDGALLDTFRLPRGFWEAKDEHDDLDKEIRAKLDKGYPRNNIIFQAPERAVLYQHGVRQGLNEDISTSANLVELLKVFFGYREPHYEEWDAAGADFKGYIPQIAAAVKEKIENQRRTNPAFVQRFDAFYELCRQSINPNLSVEAVETMLIQHLLTERIFRRIFDNADFTRRNVIAVEIEKIIDSMTAREFSRDSFLKDLDRFYKAIELAAESTEDYSQKQQFLNSVYQRFFQGYSPKEADTHGIVYTPQPIVDFMVRSVEDILKKEFGRSLSDKDVHILDPFVGTGNFITRVMKEIKTSALPYKYENELHCNEVMLLPYYVASMNIEHEYLERTGGYKAFPGICLVDTFELAEPEQSKLSFMSEENTARVKRQKQSPIFVIIANPPYNTQQVNENDENKNRKYPVMDARIASTYAADSEASLKSKLSDVYVKAFRLASDRIGNSGIVAFVTNNTFIDGKAFDGMRENLLRDFDTIYHLNFKGNARTSGERRKREGGNIFLDQIRVSVGITLLIRNPAIRTEGRGVVNIWSVNDYLDAASKIDALEKFGGCYDVPYVRVSPQGGESWFTSGQMSDVSDLIPLGIKSEKKTQYPASIFRLFSLGVATNRDPWAYSSRHSDLETLLARTASHFTVEKDRWNRCAVKGGVKPDHRGGVKVDQRRG
jgi:predicted helicase